MVDSMKKVANLDVELTVEERNLLSVGNKNVIGARRASWRILSSIEQKEETKGNEVNVKQIKEYRQKLELELSNICNDVMRVNQLCFTIRCEQSCLIFYYRFWCYIFLFCASGLWVDRICCVQERRLLSLPCRV